MRICRFTAGDDLLFGVLTGDVDEFGQPEEDATIVALAGDPLYVGIKLLEEEHKLADVRLLAPVIPRSKVVGVGRNYAEHAAELGNEVPNEPLIFIKPNTSVIGPGDPIALPDAVATSVHFEGELAVVIGRICRDVPAERVDRRHLRLHVGNDVTARDLQKSDVQLTRAKGFDSFCPLGPWIETDCSTFADGVQIRGPSQRRAQAGRADQGHDLRRPDAHLATSRT